MTEQCMFFYIILIHFLADFALQTHEQSLKKGEGISLFNKFLFYHVGVYSITWWIAMGIISGREDLALGFAFVTFVTHYIIDWITSRLGKSFWTKQDFHNGFVVVGFDQMLHYIQLLLTYKLIFG